MKSLISIPVILSLLYAHCAFAQAPSEPSIRPLSEIVQAAQKKIAIDQAAVEAASQAFKKDLAQLKIEQAAGNTAAIEAVQARLEAGREQLNSARETLQTDLLQLRRDAAGDLKADKAAVLKALTKLKASRGSADIDTLEADIAAMQNAYEQAVSHRQALGFASPADEYAAEVQEELAAATQELYQNRLIADQEAIKADKQAILLDTEQLKADKASGDEEAIAASEARLKAGNDQLLADQVRLNEDRRLLGLPPLPLITDPKPIVILTGSSHGKPAGKSSRSGSSRYKAPKQQEERKAPKKKLNSKLGSMSSRSRHNN